MIKQNEQTGELLDGHIRYLTIRADVLMGLAAEWPQGAAAQFVQALERSVYRHSRDSFESYLATNRFTDTDFLAATAAVAARLGWGRWLITALPDGSRQVKVDNSPFAHGFGPSSEPVCGAICGVLRAIVSVGYGQTVSVTEERCAAQPGASECVFRLT